MIMADKGIRERDIIKQCLPNTCIVICLLRTPHTTNNNHHNGTVYDKNFPSNIYNNGTFYEILTLVDLCL